MQIPLGDCGSLSSFVENCLATVGVCVFYASASAGAFFKFGGFYYDNVWISNEKTENNR